MKQTTKSSVSWQASTEAVVFTDGMLVTSDDLSSAMHYPLSVVQVLLRSYFGCGIVCGLDLANPAASGGRPVRPAYGLAGAHADDAGAAAKPAGQEPQTPHQTHGQVAPARGFVVQIAPGVALGCDGYPIELCELVKLDLSPDPCGCPTDAEVVKYIAIRRTADKEAPSRGCGCGAGGGDPAQQCSRLRDHVLIRAFDSKEDLPKGICRRADPKPQGQAAEETACACLKHCPDCDRCAEPWVLIGTVRLGDDGIADGGINDPDDSKLPEGGRRYVKPIACLCDAPKVQGGGGLSEAEWADWEARYRELRMRIDILEGRVGAGPPPPPPPHGGGPRGTGIGTIDMSAGRAEGTLRTGLGLASEMTGLNPAAVSAAAEASAASEESQPAADAEASPPPAKARSTRSAAAKAGDEPKA